MIKKKEKCMKIYVEYYSSKNDYKSTIRIVTKQTSKILTLENNYKQFLAIKKIRNEHDC